MQIFLHTHTHTHTHTNLLNGGKADLTDYGKSLPSLQEIQLQLHALTDNPVDIVVNEDVTVRAKCKNEYLVSSEGIIKCSDSSESPKHVTIAFPKDINIVEAYAGYFDSGGEWTIEAYVGNINNNKTWNNGSDSLGSKIYVGVTPGKVYHLELTYEENNDYDSSFSVNSYIKWNKEIQSHKPDITDY